MVFSKKGPIHLPFRLAITNSWILYRTNVPTGKKDLNSFKTCVTESLLQQNSPQKKIANVSLLTL